MNTNSQPDISICIANYNGGDLVLACLDSVFSQCGHFTFEVLVHDDVSSDDSVARIRAIHPGVLIIQGTHNVGFCISNNRMVDAARGRYLLLLNNDAVLRPGSLSALLAFADEQHADSILGLPQHAMADGSLIDRGYRIDPFLNPIPILQPGSHEVGVVTGACLWIPRVVWDHIGGFPAWFESVAEDIFICMAARLLGHRVLMLDGPGFDHWIGKNLGGGKVVDSSLRTTVRRRALSERNKTFVMLCCYPWPIFTALMPLHIAFLLCEAIFLCASGVGFKKVVQIYAGIPSAIWHFRGKITALRSRLMRQRIASISVLFAFTDWLPYKVRMLLRYGVPHVA